MKVMVFLLSTSIIILFQSCIVKNVFENINPCIEQIATEKQIYFNPGRTIQLKKEWPKLYNYISNGHIAYLEEYDQYLLSEEMNIYMDSEEFYFQLQENTFLAEPTNFIYVFGKPSTVRTDRHGNSLFLYSDYNICFPDRDTEYLLAGKTFYFTVDPVRVKVY